MTNIIEWFFSNVRSKSILHDSSYSFLRKIQSRIFLTNTYKIFHFKIVKCSLRGTYSFFIDICQLFYRLLKCINFSWFKMFICHKLKTSIFHAWKDYFWWGGGEAEVNITIYIVVSELRIHSGSYKRSFLHRLRPISKSTQVKLILQENSKCFMVILRFVLGN